MACFVKLFGTVFLGQPRGDAARHARDAEAGLYVPMGVLAMGCCALGVLPWLAIPLLDQAVAAWSWGLAEPALSLNSLASFAPISGLAVLLLLLSGATVLLVRRALRRQPLGRAGTWDCGYAEPSPRMQYTGASFGDAQVSLLGWALWPKRSMPKIAGMFPAWARFQMEVPDAVLDRVVAPVFRLAGHYLPALRLLQQGQVQVYVLYILAIVLVLLLWGRVGF